jgi:hypothetical protein
MANMKILSPIGQTHDDLLIYPSVSNLRTDGSGCSASFFKNGATTNSLESFALKVFDAGHVGSYLCAKAAFQRQTLAYRAGIAPPVGRMFRIEDSCLYGYETGLADRISDDEYNDLFGDADWDIVMSPRLRQIRRTLRRINLTGTVIADISKNYPLNAPVGSKYCLGGDLHSSNVMRWQGSLVCIDFGRHAVLTGSRGRAKPAVDVLYNR